jgi:hypothetical protein
VVTSPKTERQSVIQATKPYFYLELSWLVALSYTIWTLHRGIKYLEDVAELGLKVCLLRYVREIEGRLSPHEQSNELVGYGGNIFWQNDVINSLYGFS